MTKEKAIELAIQYQKEHHGSVKISKVHWIDQEKMDALTESLGKPIPADWPDWARPLAHWTVLFDLENNMVPNEDVVSVYDDGVVTSMPIM